MALLFAKHLVFDFQHSCPSLQQPQNTLTITTTTQQQKQNQKTTCSIKNHAN
jgi:hypothetical protein